MLHSTALSPASSEWLSRDNVPSRFPVPNTLPIPVYPVPGSWSVLSATTPLSSYRVVTSPENPPEESAADSTRRVKVLLWGMASQVYSPLLFTMMGWPEISRPF